MTEGIHILAVWLFRAVRRRLFSLAGRNPLFRLGSPARWSEALAAISRQRELAQFNHHLLSSTDTGAAWQTTTGTIQTPAGADQADMFRLTKHLPASLATLRATDHVVLDIGSEVGLFPLEALRRGVDTVIAIEPSPDMAECLNYNLKSYIGAGCVKVVSNRNSETGLGRMTIDEAVERLNINRLDYIRIHSSLAGIDVLEGARQTLARFRPRVCVCPPEGDDGLERTEGIMQALTRLGYRCRCIDEHPYRSDRRGWLMTASAIVCEQA